MFSILRIFKEYKKSLLDLSEGLDQIADHLDDTLISLGNCIITLINVIHPKTIHCELNLYILD